MALKKDVVQDNGLVLGYHRIADIINIVNGKTLLEIYSYLNREEREKELNANQDNNIIANVYISKSIEKLDYDDTLTIYQAYNYLKTLDKYKDAEDI